MRTTLLDADGNPRYTNRLVDESSPYLVQHAHNPVDWYPWGEEAFSRARQEDKPVFLSIGYSTCHWCHVMEHESFDNEEIAAFLNRHFVSIKLDREQRPDLDELYMTGVQMLTGQGGWPMSNFLTVDGKPFYAGTYFPAANFLALLQQIAGIWKERRDDVLKQAEEIAAGIARFTTARAEARSLPEDLYGSASVELLGRFDEVNGGFGGAPKFPNESMLMLLLDDWQRNGNRRALDASMHTLAKMSEGGIHDQVGGGFHRYTVDAVWLVPHFEKMLYNQAQMIRLYSGAAALTGSAACRRVVEKTFAYLTRDMMDDDGAFYSATDADSEGEEGLFFLWTRDELETVLGADDAALVEDVYGVTAAGNFEGRNILHLAVPLAEFASARDIPEAVLAARLESVHERLYRAREERVHPLRDEKIITAWNAMTVTSLAQAGHEMAREDMLAAAIRAATAVWNRAWDAEAGTLWRISFAGQVSVPGNLEDYACLSEALLSLYRFTFDRRWLERGREMVMRMIEEFADEEGGGFFLARRRDEGPMIARPKSPMDGATPSANSVALSSLVLLNAMTGDPEIEARITACINAFAGLMVASPSAFPYMICAAGQYRHGLLGQVRFAGAGNVRVACHRDDAGCRLELTFADGWHVNAHEVADPSLIGTEVDAGAATVEYPRGQAHRYEEAATITIRGDVAAFDLRLQACSEDRCLAPETLHFR